MKKDNIKINKMTKDYTILKGDNLSTISKNSGVKQEKLQKINNIENPDFDHSGKVNEDSCCMS